MYSLLFFAVSLNAGMWFDAVHRDGLVAGREASTAHSKKMPRL